MLLEANNFLTNDKIKIIEDTVNAYEKYSCDYIEDTVLKAMKTIKQITAIEIQIDNETSLALTAKK